MGWAGYGFIDGILIGRKRLQRSQQIDWEEQDWQQELVSRRYPRRKRALFRF